MLELENRLLSCPGCAASDFSIEGDLLACRPCGAEYPIRGGIVDFVGGRLGTSLDAIDYDAYYGVDDPKINRSFELIREHIGSLLDRPLGSVLELGAGTGLLTTGLLRSAALERLLVTDLSPKMLAACRKRVESLSPATKTELCFATNDGVVLSARRGEFDLVLGYFVVHHILDWRKTLVAAREATNDRGVAVFVEPNRRFHLALLLVMNRVLERLLPEMPDLPGSDLSNLLNLVSEWDFTLKYADQFAALERQEDKHFFDRLAFEDACRAAGWAFVRTERFDSRTGPFETAKVYADQLRLSPKGSQRFLDVYLSELPGPFALLDEVDASPSYVFSMGKHQDDVLHLGTPGPPIRAAPVELVAPSVGYAVVYDLDITVTAAAPHVAVVGWITATRPVMRVIVWVGEFRVSFAVGTRRVDVVRGMARLRRHPFANLLHSGVRGVESMSGKAPTIAETIRVVAELDDGNELALVSGRKLERTAEGGWRTRISVLD